MQKIYSLVASGVISVSHGGKCLQYKVYRENVHRPEVVLIKAIKVNPGVLFFLGEVIVQAT
jgi:hypothetical protein